MTTQATPPEIQSTERVQSVLEQAISAALAKVIDPMVGLDGVDRTKIENNPLMQAAELKRCSEDAAYWMSHYAFTYDPRDPDPANRSKLLKLWPKQVEMVQWMERKWQESQHGQVDCAIQKSRDSGVSCVCAAFAVHKWLFQKDFKWGFGSYTEKKVDSLGDPDSLFEKIRIMIRKLPPWMKPRGMKDRDHLLQCRVSNPETGSIIIGEIGDNIGRGGRNAGYVVDESSFLEHPDLADHALTGNAPFRLDVSTPNGIGNWFFRKVHSLPPDNVFTFAWQDDPRKDEVWKEAMIAAKGQIVFEREYNLNYAASLEGIAIPSEWVRSAVDLPIPAVGEIVAGFDVADEGENESVLAPRQGSVIHKLITWSKINTTQSAHTAARHLEEMKAVRVFYDAVGSSVKGTWDSMLNDQGDESHLPFETVPVVGQEAASKTKVWPDGKTSYQKFANVRAEMWWIMRTRFEKTYEYVKWQNGEPGGAFHEVDELISIPNDPTLINQLSTPLIEYNSKNGKIQIESKVKMKQRGVKSPDRADATAYSWYNKDPKRPFWFL